MSKLFHFHPKDDELTKLSKYRLYLENRAMGVLEWRVHLVKDWWKLEEKPIQNKKDNFLYRYYSHQYNIVDDLINKISNTYE